MEIETPLSPVLISSNQPAAMEVDDIIASPPPNPVEQAPVIGPRPTLADILKVHEVIRKDKALKKATFKIEMPNPLAADLRAIEQIFEAGRPTWEVLFARLEAAQPFQIPRAKFSVVLETGQALVRTSPSQILQSFVRDHGNKSLAELFAKKNWSNFKNTWW
uniref:AlNc14C176G8114 protein n=1 Tax=Albugo laibachii Nc14 TaxID=890382 RepID=F0WNV9_9STRA|nr:AlNc14C176G8114 [Albugo laibachii Nc14]|eukprot:CCA23002.1 AlNc14C176G8114 [Albugo laibachii Nc14]